MSSTWDGGAYWSGRRRLQIEWGGVTVSHPDGSMSALTGTEEHVLNNILWSKKSYSRKKKKTQTHYIKVLHLRQLYNSPQTQLQEFPHICWSTAKLPHQYPIPLSSIPTGRRPMTRLSVRAIGTATRGSRATRDNFRLCTGDRMTGILSFHNTITTLYWQYADLIFSNSVVSRTHSLLSGSMQSEHFVVYQLYFVLGKATLVVVTAPLAMSSV